MKTNIVGHSTEAEVVKKGNILNRIMRATSLSCEYECDQRHVEVLVEELALSGAKPLAPPGVEGEKLVGVVESPPFGPEKASLFRALFAGGNFIAVDRADVQSAIKELCRDMSAPTGIMECIDSSREVLLGQASCHPRVSWARGSYED